MQLTRVKVQYKRTVIESREKMDAMRRKLGNSIKKSEPFVEIWRKARQVSDSQNGSYTLYMQNYIIGASLSEPHINGTAVCELYIIMVRRSREIYFHMILWTYARNIPIRILMPGLQAVYTPF